MMDKGQTLTRLTNLLPASLLAMLMFVQLCMAGAVNAAENGLTALRLGSVSVDGQPALRLVVETSTPATVKMSLLSAPYRLVIDMRDVAWQIDSLPKKGRLDRSPATAYRFGQPEPGTGRLVIEMDSPAAPFRAFALPPNKGGHRLVIDMADNGRTAFQVAAAALRDSKPIQFGGAELTNDQRAVGAETKMVASAITPPIPKPKQAKPAVTVTPAVAVPKPQKRPNRWVVFIDAGHGGKDPGAIGRAGTKEKDITLAAAIELARQLRGTGQIRAVLSRRDDRYLKLRQRIKLARAQNADLFVSLHADSAASKSARGMSVFTLSETASDKEAAALARNENKADLIGGPDLGVEDPEAANELLRMFQRESMNQSTHFAGKILQEIRDMPGGDKRGHRFAGFAVLKAPDMPSVLVEMGFLSNREDEANLNRKSYRRKLAGRLTGAIVRYLEEFGPEI
jgi:N-acetylmuramoyl-L-alanine amidase